MILHTILGCPLFSCTSLRAPLKFPKFSVVNVLCSQKALKIRGFSTEKSEINYPTGRYEYTRNAYAMYDSLALHPWNQSVLIFPMDLVIDSLVRCEILGKWPIFNGKVRNYAIQRTDMSTHVTHLQCMGHKYSIHNVKACLSFRWLAHLSVARFWEMWSSQKAYCDPTH